MTLTGMFDQEIKELIKENERLCVLVNQQRDKIKSLESRLANNQTPEFILVRIRELESENELLKKELEKARAQYKSIRQLI